MSQVLPSDIQDLVEQLEANTRAGHAVAEGLTAERGEWRAQPGSWSVAQCLDHLATGNRVYLDAMRPPAARAREQRRLRSGPAKAGFFGRLFVRSLEPPVRPSLKQKAPRKIKPQPSPRLADAFAAFVASQQDVIAFLQDSADLDLTHVTFPNPFIGVIHFSLATGFNVLASHGRRHLWQAANVRRAAEVR